MSDPFRQNAATADDATLGRMLAEGPVSRGAGWRAAIGEDQITNRWIGLARVRAHEAFRASPAFGGREFAPDGTPMDRLTPEQANEQFGVEGEQLFNEPVSPVRAAEMHRQAVERRFREETVDRSGISWAERLGASVLGAATDPVMLPTWFIGGGASALRVIGLGAQGGRAANIGRGAAVGVIDGLAGGAVAEGINYSVRRSTGEDYSGGDALRNILFGGALGGVVGGTAGAFQRPISAGDWAAAIQRQETGSNPYQVSRDPDGPGPAGGGAVGAMQLLPDTARKMARRLNLPYDRQRLLNDVAYNQQLGREYLRVLEARYGGDQFLATTAYHAGERNVDRWLRRHGDPRSGAISRSDWLARVERNNPRSARYPREVFAKLGLDLDGGASGPSLEALTPPSPPRALEGLSAHERAGSWVEALEAMAEDGPVDLGASLARRGLEALDEATAAPSIRGRWLEADTAVTRRGGEVPVRFAVVELDDLVTSHTDDLTVNPAFPQALQPRDRSRAGSQAANYELERDLNPALLMRDRAASGGAPIISPDGLVESGNGRTIALRRSAATGTEAWGRYVGELKRQGIDTDGYARPVLVRVRTEPMTGEARAEMGRALNEAPTEAFSPVEQARADARRLDRPTLDLLSGDDPFAAAERPFLRGFVARVAPNEANALTDARGAISLAGKARVQAALVQAAYGDDLLTAALFETGDPTIAGIGRALADAAPAWARMLAEAPAAMDLTPNLRSAVALIREARTGRMSVGEMLESRLGQTEMFGAETLSPETEAMIRLMFRDEAMTKPRGAERIADALKSYARSAAETPAGPDLFGDLPDGRATLETLIARYAGAEGEGQSGLAWAGGSEPLWTTRETDGPGLDLRRAEPDGDGPGGGGDGRAGGAGAGADDAAGRLKAAGIEGVTVGPDQGHGPVIAGLEGRWAETVTALKTLEAGDVRGALSHPAVGAIDMVWGRAPTTPQASDGWGLAKLLVKHPEVVADLPARLEAMTVTQVLPDRINLASADDRAAVRLDWDGEAKTWLVTAFAKADKGGPGVRGGGGGAGEGGRGGGGSSVSAALDGPAPSPNPSAGPNIAPDGGGRQTPQARVAAIIAGDPELKALMADTEALAQAAGVDMPGFTPSTEPSTVAEAIRAAAFCLATETVG